MNDKNLKPQNKRTKSEQREIARKGGIASGEARRQKKAIAEMLRAVLDERASVGSDKSRIEVIIAKTIQTAYNDPSLDNLLKIQKLLGEAQLGKVNVGQDGQIVIQLTQEQKDDYDNLIDAIH